MENMHEQEIDLMELWAAWNKRKAFVGKITAGFVIAATAYCFLVSPTYEATSTVRIRPQKGIGSSLLDMAGGNINAQAVNTYMEILKNRVVIDGAIARLEKTGNEKYVEEAENLDKKIKVATVKNTELVSIAVPSKDPEYAQKANQALLDSFLETLTKAERQQYSLTRQFLEGRVSEAKKEMNKAEDNLGEFQKEHKIISPENTVQMAAEKMAMTDKLKAQNRIDMESASAMAGAIDGQMKGNTRAIADNGTLQAYNTQLAKLESQRIEYAAKYTAKHPAMVKINQDIDSLKAKMDEEIQRIARLETNSGGVYNEMLANKLKSEAEASVARQNLASLETIENDFKKDIDKLSDSNKEHLRLLRDVTVSQEIYTMLAKRLEEAKVAEVSISRDVQIVENPIVPEEPVAPRKARVIGLAMLLGFFLSSAYAVGKEMFNRTIKTSEDVANYLGLPVLGEIPDFDGLEKNMANEKKTSFMDKIGGIF